MALLESLGPAQKGLSRTARLLDDAQMHSAKNVRTELILSGWLVLMVVSYSVFLAFG